MVPNIVAAFLFVTAPNPITDVGTSPAPIDTGVPNLIPVFLLVKI